MADTKEFDVIRVARSDGADTGPGYWPAPAKKPPAKEPQAAAPRAKPQMTRLAEDDARFIEWRIKLGILLKQELSPLPDGKHPVPLAKAHWTLTRKDGNPWYVQFPRGYWLYEKSKHLWVSGYPIKAKLFRSPQEFGVHLLWLLSSSKDYTDCCCVHCNPAAPKTTTDDNLIVEAKPKVTPVPLPHIPGQKPAPSPSPSPQAQPPPQPLQPQPQPHSQSQSQPQPQPIRWSLHGALLFRAGELVWYQTGQAWRLGIISPPTASEYHLLPLGHALVTPNQSITKGDADIRPYQTFMLPAIDTPELKDVHAFDKAPWDPLFRSTNDHQRLVLDASKLAAANIDASYSLWNAMSQDPNADPFPYFGCFLGAERLEVGDCLRIKQDPAASIPDGAVMGLRLIFTRREYPGAVFFRGNVYLRITPEQQGGPLVPHDQLPVALQHEAAWRKQAGRPARWILLGEDVTLPERAIGGRFYPTHKILPILNPAVFNDAVARGAIDQLQVYLNDRLDNAPLYFGRRPSRAETLGLALPQGAGVALEPAIREAP